MCSVYHLWFGTESQVEWAVPLSLKRLLTAPWHMDNPTRNQSLHSYWGNRWANMFPDGCPYYSGASRPQETVEPDGIEVLSLLNEQVMNYSRTNGQPHGRWGILPPRVETEGEWQYSLTHTFASTIPAYVLESVNGRGWEWLDELMNKVRTLRDADNDSKQTSSNLFWHYKPNCRSDQRDSDTAFFRIALKLHDTWYWASSIIESNLPSLFFFWLLFLKPADLLWH